MRRFFNKLAAGVMVATMAFTALAPVTTMAAGNDHTHSFTTATTTPSTSDKDDKNPSTSTTPSTSDKDSDTIPIKGGNKVHNWWKSVHSNQSRGRS